jgi:AcrR family transcriptional regulator
MATGRHQSTKTPDEAGRSRRRRGEPRKLLLDAANEIFTAKGFAGTSTREIAERAGVSETLMFRYFGSKVGLFREALVTPFADFVQSFNERWKMALDEGFDVEKLTRQFISELFDLFRSHRGLVVMLWSADAQTESELAEAGVFDEVVEHLQTLVQIGSASAERAGGFSEPSHDLLTRSTLSMVAGMAVFGRSFYGPKPPKRAEIIDALTLISLRTHMPDATDGRDASS